MTLEEKTIIESIKNEDLQALAGMVGMQGELLRKVLREIWVLLMIAYVFGTVALILEKW